METISTGVLIIGSGGAGLRCAIELKENGYQDVLVVGARKFNDAHTTLAAGGLNAAIGSMDPKDSWEVHAADTFYEGQFISNPHLVQTLTSKAPEALEDLLKFGAQFHKEEDGKLSQRFFGAHTYRRTVFSGDETGKEIIRVLVKRAEELEVKYLENTYIFKLLVDDGKIVGAAGVNQDNKVVIVSAGAVVLATGGFANIYKRSSSRHSENYGNAIVMAYEAGAKIGDLELIQFHPTALVYPDNASGLLVTEAVRAEGGILKNAFGERFMSKYDPDKMELSTRDIVSRANFFEIRDGNGSPNGGVYLDISDRTSKYLKERLPRIYETLKKVAGIDIDKERVEVAPTAHYTMGGIHFDHKSLETNLTGLYTIGECSMGVHGANRLGGNSLAEILVFGKLLGSKLAASKVRVGKEIKQEIKSDLEKEIHGICKEGEELTDDILSEVKNTLWNKVGIVRNEIEMNGALNHLEEIEEKLNERGLIRHPDLKKCLLCNSRVSAVTQLGKLVTKAAIERKESRGAHYRTDYNKLDKDFECNLLFEKTAKKDNLERRSIPKPTAEFEKAIKSNTQTKNYTHLE